MTSVLDEGDFCFEGEGDVFGKATLGTASDLATLFDDLPVLVIVSLCTITGERQFP